MKSLNRQVGGQHYKEYKIEPIVYVSKNKIIHTLANIIKYASRANYRDNLEVSELRKKIEDLEKIIHYAEIEIELAIEEHEESVGPFLKEIQETSASVPAPVPSHSSASRNRRFESNADWIGTKEMDGCAECDDE